MGKRCEWCWHDLARHVYPAGSAPQCHRCKSGFCTPKPGSTFRVNRKLKERWKKGKLLS